MNFDRIKVNVAVEQQVEWYDPGDPSQGFAPRLRIYEMYLKEHIFAANGSASMGEFVQNMSSLMLKNKRRFGILAMSTLFKVQVLKLVDGEDLWITVGRDASSKTVREVVVDPKDENENWVVFVFRLTLENNPRLANVGASMSKSIGCNSCGKESPETKEGCSHSHDGRRQNFYAGVFSVDIEEATLRNPHYRVVINTTNEQQLVLMSISPEDKEIGREVHPHTTQMIRIEKGRGQAIVDGSTIELKDGSLVMINPGAEHNIINTSKDGEDLKLYTIYSPPHHPPGTIHKRKKDDQ